MFSYEYGEISKNTFFTEHGWTVASQVYSDLDYIILVITFSIWRLTLLAYLTQMEAWTPELERLHN